MCGRDRDGAGEESEETEKYFFEKVEVRTIRTIRTINRYLWKFRDLYSLPDTLLPWKIILFIQAQKSTTSCAVFMLWGFLSLQNKIRVRVIRTWKLQKTGPKQRHVFSE